MTHRYLNRRVLLGTAIGLTLGWLAGAAVSNSMALSSKEPLIGTWKVTLTPSAEAGSSAKELTDIMTFRHDETFNSEFLKRNGFIKEKKPLPKFQEDRRPFGPCQWNATVTDEKAGTVKYQGTADGQTLTGQMTFTRKDGAAVTYEMKGEPKK